MRRHMSWQIAEPHVHAGFCYLSANVSRTGHTRLPRGVCVTCWADRRGLFPCNNRRCGGSPAPWDKDALHLPSIWGPTCRSGRPSLSLDSMPRRLGSSHSSDLRPDSRVRECYLNTQLSPQLTNSSASIQYTQVVPSPASLPFGSSDC